MFKSILTEEMASFLELRKSIVSAKSVANDKSVLTELDKYLEACHFPSKNLSEDILNSWRRTLRGSSKTIQTKVVSIRNFIKYLNELGIRAFVPEAPKKKSDYIPHIYTDDELVKIFDIADNMAEYGAKSISLAHIELPMILRILFGCGTRIGETLELQRKDIDFKTQTMLLRKTKGCKERLIPVHGTLTVILEQYCLAINIMFLPDAYLFPGKKPKTHLTHRHTLKLFNDVLRQANISQDEHTGQRRGPCLHDFRHLFVLKCICQLEKEGHPVDLNDLLLPTYLGHEGLLDTDSYMKFSGVLQTDSIEAFEAYTFGLIPDVEVPYEEK